MEYIEVTDQDCHHYVIPFEKLLEWYRWEESEEYSLGIIPDYAIEVDGGSVVFKEWRIR